MKHWLGLILLLVSGIAMANAKVLNVYTWSNYIPNKVIQEFQQQTGIEVHVSYYDGNATLYTKLKADPHIGYDIIIPSSFYVQRMAEEGMLHRINKRKLKDFNNLNPLFLNRPFDPGNHYSIPYLWGTTGIIVDTRYWNPKSITRWSDLWQPRFKNKLLILNSAREAFTIAMLSLGYSMNDTNPQHIKQAFLKLKKLMPNIRLFNSTADADIYGDEDVSIGMVWSGDAMLAKQNNPHLRFIYPKDGFAIWVDCLAIPKFAPHLQNAYKFINFVLRPRIAKQIVTAEAYSTPNLAAVKLMPKKWRESPIFNPSNKVLKRAHFQLYLGKANLIYQKYWELLKLGDGD